LKEETPSFGSTIALGGANLENLALFELLVTDTCDECHALDYGKNNGIEVLLVAYF